MASKETEKNNIGSRLRELRRERKLSLQKVASIAGLSIGLISQIERGITTPSVRSLKLISHAIGIPVDILFTQPEQPVESEEGYIVRTENRRVISLESHGMILELLSPMEVGNVQTFITTIFPGGGSGLETESHIGEETGIVLNGRLELWVGDRHFLLQEGDVFKFNSTEEHRYLNPGRAISRVHFSISPPLYSMSNNKVFCSPRAVDVSHRQPEEA